ncbi:hypothetical protein BWR19_00470 [Halomonas sp. 1513]|nr:FCD domain-containing protein [Halomonas sp. 1513]APX91548.1 hypothetical protein BWR19_00470 [Halomonas sp. 1513]
MNTLAPANGPLQAHSLTNLAQLEIERMILGGLFMPGERINENALANQLGISRGPVREACRTLAAMGLVQLIPNRGVFIRVISEEEAREVYEIRAGIFGYAGMLLAQRIDDSQLAYLKQLIEQMEEAARANDFDRYYAPNLTFHDFLVSATGNRRLITTYHDLVRQLHLFRSRGLVSGDGMLDSNREHREIVTALEARDALRSLEAMTGHVEAGQLRALGKATRTVLV